MNKPVSSQSPPDQSAPGLFGSLPGRLLLILCLLQSGLLIWLLRTNHHPIGAANKSRPVSKVSTNQPITPASSSAQEPYVWDQPGPWGTLEYVRIAIEPPDDFIPTEDGAFPQTHWRFAGYTAAQITNLFQSADLTPAQRAALLNPAAWSQDTNGLVVIPETSVILELNPSARAQIYAALAQDGRNMFQAWPYTFRADGVDQWFTKGGVDDSTITLLKRLLYSRGASLCFSDLPEVFAQIPSLDKRRSLLKTLSRNSTILMKLRVSPDSDIKALTTYWTGLWAAKDIGPLIESLTDIPGGMTVDIAHLLPPFARKRLNSYPILDSSNRWPDCYWTSFNFFNEPPDDRYYDANIWSAELKTNYTTVAQAGFGDIIFLLHADGTPVHAAVYIADDVVFTKNGGNYRQPWILMKWDDLIARYPENASLHKIIFRSNKKSKL